MSTAPRRAEVRADRRGRRRGTATVVVVISAVLVALVVGVLAVRSIVSGPKDFEGSGTGSVEVTIPQGASATRIGEILADAGSVASVGAFTGAATANPDARSIGPGTYAVALGMSGEAAVLRLLDPSALIIERVVIPEGSTVDEVAAAIAASTTISREQVDKVMADPGSLPLPSYAKDRLEGFLFPATYDVDPADTARDVVTSMVDRFNAAAADIDLAPRAREAGRDPYDVVVAASLVEAEVAPADFGKAARVIDNRIEAGMRLQFDSTVNYARGSSDLTLSTEELATDSPYNTYRVVGLPPTPIGSPSEAALEAVLDPDPGDWIYFVSTDPDKGITKFTASYQEFLEFKAEFQATQQ